MTNAFAASTEAATTQRLDGHRALVLSTARKKFRPLRPSVHLSSKSQKRRVSQEGLACQADLKQASLPQAGMSARTLLPLSIARVSDARLPYRACARHHPTTNPNKHAGPLQDLRCAEPHTWGVQRHHTTGTSEALRRQARAST